MKERFQAYRIYETNGNVSTQVESLQLDDLSAGEVTVRVHYSTINYKDALAATGKARYYDARRWFGGIDLSGEVIASEDSRYRRGDLVLVTGCGLSETHDGGYAQVARVRGDWVIPLPSGLSIDDAMRIGTVGFSAALAIDRMEANGQHPAQGPIVVTGATGGVGSHGQVAGCPYSTTALVVVFRPLARSAAYQMRRQSSSRSRSSDYRLERALCKVPLG